MAIEWSGPFKSNRKYKKFYVIVKDDTGREETIHFGDTRYEDFTQHGDEKRRERYLKRAKGIKNKKGELTYLDPFSPNYWSVKLLW